MGKNTILIADDAEINRDMLSVIFEEQYKILEAADGNETIQLIEEHTNEIALVFLDLIMPNKSGLDVLSYLVEKHLQNIIPVIMITGEATVATDEKAYEYGASDIIYKPFEPSVVMRRAKNIIELFENRIALEEKLDERTKQLIESRNAIEKSNEFLVNALTAITESGTMESEEHVQRIKYYTNILLGYVKDLYPHYGLNDDKIRLIVNASALHDIGKISISDNILAKTGKLTPDEERELRRHTIYGSEMLEKINQKDNDFYKYCYDICRYHHERVDGKGYPDHLKGDEIPIWSEVVGLADAFDDLVAERVYRTAYAADEAARMIERGECGAFSENVLRCFKMARSQLFEATEMTFSYVDSVS
jgi:putative two-component system response regulator